ncbi:LysR family transcriptional regulator [Streptomyces sp. NPDC102274]|uniref:LysR family transcriptional regulator n=1 Tax=Streptomyces sp. NPDC102274 TaxID=3366151 RepID=UPI00382B9F9F
MRTSPPDLSSLQLLTLVAELGSLGQAAERMEISQPAASKRLPLLERRLGLTLVNRDTRGSELTAEGKTVCQWSGRVLTEMDSLRRRRNGRQLTYRPFGAEMRCASRVTRRPSGPGGIWGASKSTSSSPPVREPGHGLRVGDHLHPPGRALRAPPAPTGHGPTTTSRPRHSRAERGIAACA